MVDRDEHICGRSHRREYAESLEGAHVERGHDRPLPHGIGRDEQVLAGKGAQHAREDERRVAERHGDVDAASLEAETYGQGGAERIRVRSNMGHEQHTSTGRERRDRGIPVGGCGRDRPAHASSSSVPSSESSWESSARSSSTSSSSRGLR